MRETGMSDPRCNNAKEPELMSLISKIKSIHEQIGENLAMTAKTLEPIKIPVPATDCCEKSSAPEEALSPIGDCVRGILKDAQSLLRASQELHRNLAI